MSVTYGQVEYERPSETLRGADVEGEHGSRIARHLSENGIRYEHEAVAPRDARVFKRILAKPDFYLPDFDIYVEYWGMADAGLEYVQQMRRRMAVYNRHNIKFISIFPEDFQQARLGLSGEVQGDRGVRAASRRLEVRRPLVQWLWNSA